MIERTPNSANPTAVDSWLKESTVSTENNPMLHAK
jgi:hypothetical protein